MILDILFASSLLLSAASQLRPEGLPIGPGELCLTVWIVLVLAGKAMGPGPSMTPALSRLLIFWMVFTLALCFGTMTGYAIGDVHDQGLFLHDVMAYPLLATVSCIVVVEPGAGQRLRRITWCLAIAGAGFLLFQLGNAYGLFEIGSFVPWYWDRLRGWTDNPNQLALLCAVLGLLSLHLGDTAIRRRDSIVALGCMGVSVATGLLTRSDAFSLSLVAATVLYLALKIRASLLVLGPRLSFRSASAWISILALPLALVAVSPLTYSITVDAENVAKSISKDDGRHTGQEAQLRFNVWSEAVRRGIQSGLLGLGPGPHLAIPPSIVAARLSASGEPDIIDHPEINSTPNFEAHDTLLDLLTQGGLLAVASFGWLTTSALWRAYRARLDGLTTLLCSLAVFSVFHLIIRHPLVWFAIALSLVEGFDGRKAVVARHRT